MALRYPEWPTNVRVRFFFRQPSVAELHPRKMDETREVKVSQLAEDPDTAEARGAKPWRHKALSAFLNSLKRPLSGGWGDEEIAPILQLFSNGATAMENQIKRQKTLTSMFAARVDAKVDARGDASMSSFAPLPPRAPSSTCMRKAGARAGGEGGKKTR